MADFDREVLPERIGCASEIRLTRWALPMRHTCDRGLWLNIEAFGSIENGAPAPLIARSLGNYRLSRLACVASRYRLRVRYDRRRRFRVCPP
jgi:hypothetical protein